MCCHRIRRVVVAGLVASGAAVLAALPAAAQIETEPHEVPAGQPTAVSFVVERGCGGDSPTVKLEIRVPDEIDDAKFIPIAGWNGSTSGQVVTITGGLLEAGRLANFGIEFTAPDTEGVELFFPIVQTCTEESLELVSQTRDGGLPAPVVMVVAAESGDAESTVTTRGDDGSGARDATEDTESTNRTPLIAGVIGLLVMVGGGYSFVRRRMRASNDPPSD